jgi:HD superfamily phosphodiesterase
MESARQYLIVQHPGWPHIWAHSLRVIGTVLAVAPEAGIEPAHAFMLGLFHDLGKLEELNGGDDHEKVGAKLLQQKLAGSYDSQVIILMADAIAKRGSANNPYAKLIHNADKLDKIGATGIARRLSTDWGAIHISEALRRVKSDLNRFPEMSFPTAIRLANIKMDFSRAFLTATADTINSQRSQLA